MMAAAKPVPAVFKVFYICLNVFSACTIVFANKLVFSTFKFHFVTTLTFIHTVTTWLGMMIMAQTGFFTRKSFTALSIAPLALGYVGYIILNNLSLNLNTVGFYQILKIAIAPCVMLLEYVMYRKTVTTKVFCAVAVTCIGVTVATVTDKVAISNIIGLFVGLASVVVTALYQIWAGSKQKELQANSSQLLLAYTPQAILLLLFMMPTLDKMGTPGVKDPNSVMGYFFFALTWQAAAAIAASALLGVLVSLSTFLVIGATSSLTYNIVGHMKTVFILTGGCLLFGDSMPPKRFLGICVTMCGIAWYTYLSVQAAAPSSSDKVKETKEELEADSREPLLTAGDEDLVVQKSSKSETKV